MDTRFESDGTYEDTPVVLLFNRTPTYVICNIYRYEPFGARRASSWLCALALQEGSWKVHAANSTVVYNSIIALTTQTWNAYLASLIVT
jgi:hypothetical protein